MKLKSLLLGSAAALALSTGAQAADAVISVVSLNACDAFGISGLTISTDDTCLSISGEVSYEFHWGDYDVAGVPVVVTSGGNFNDEDTPGGVDDGVIDYESEVTWELTFEATSESDIGQAVAVITLEGTDNFDDGDDIEFSEAYVSIGDTTVLSAGMKDSIANRDDDRAFNHLGMFLEGEQSGVDTLFAGGIAGITGGHVIQLETEFGDGIGVGVGLENIQEGEPFAGTLVGVVEVDQAWGNAHVTALVDDVLNGFEFADFFLHAGATVEFDPVRVRGAVAYDGVSDYWNGLLSAEATFDMFTIAASVEASTLDEFGFGASVGADVTDTIEVNVGFRYFNEGTPGIPDTETWQVEAEVVAAIAENLEASVALGALSGDRIPAAINPVIYGEVGLTYEPGGNFELEGGAAVNSEGGYELSFGASKSF